MDAQWFEHLRVSASAMELPRDGADDGPAHGSPWTIEGHHLMFRQDAERPLRETSRREPPSMVRHHADQEALFHHHRWVLVVRRDRGGRPFRGVPRG